jgi:hypothetical protein
MITGRSDSCCVGLMRWTFIRRPVGIPPIQASRLDVGQAALRAGMGAPVREGLTLVTFSRNDIEGVLRSLVELRSSFQEIIVVDSSGPAPRARLHQALRPTTERICAALPVGNVDLLRPFALAQASRDRVLLLDSDESLSSALKLALPTLTEADGYVIPRREDAIGGYSYHLRLFRRSKAQYSGRSHAFPVIDGPVRTLPRSLHIVHHAPRTAEYWQTADRAHRYLLSDFLERPYDQSYWSEVVGRGLGGETGLLRPLSNPQILLAHLAESATELLRTGSLGMARFRWEQGRLRRGYFWSLPPTRRAWLLQTAIEVRKSGGLTRYLGMDNVDYVQWLTRTIDPSNDGPSVLDFLVNQRSLASRPWDGTPQFVPARGHSIPQPIPDLDSN